MSAKRFEQYDRVLIKAAVKSAETGDDQYLTKALAAPGYTPDRKTATHALAKAIHVASYHGDTFQQGSGHGRDWGFEPRYPGLSEAGVLMLLKAGAVADAYEYDHRNPFDGFFRVGYVSHYEQPLWLALDLAAKINSSVLSDTRYLKILTEYGVRPTYLRQYLKSYRDMLPDEAAKMMMDAIENPVKRVRPERKGLENPFHVTFGGVNVGFNFNFTLAAVHIGLNEVFGTVFGMAARGAAFEQKGFKRPEYQSVMDRRLMRAVAHAARTGSNRKIEGVFRYAGYKPGPDILTAALSTAIRLSRYPGATGAPVDTIEGLHRMGAHLNRDVVIDGESYRSPLREAVHLVEDTSKAPYVAYMLGHVSADEVQGALEEARHVVKPVVARSLHKQAGFEEGRLSV